MKTEITQELLQLYITETEKALGLVSQDMLKLKQNPTDQSAIHSIKKVLHKIKGSSSMMGFQDVSEVAHKMEDIFLKIDNKEIEINQEIIKLIFTELGVLNLFLRSLKGEEVVVDFNASFKRLDRILFDQFDTVQKIKKITDYTPDQQTSIKNAIKGYLNIFKIEIGFQPDIENKSVTSSIIFHTLKNNGIIVDTIPEEENILTGKFSNLIKILFISTSNEQEIRSWLQSIKTFITQIKIDKIEEHISEQELFTFLHKPADKVLKIGDADAGFIEIKKGTKSYLLINILQQVKNIADKIAKDNNKLINLELNCDDIKIKEDYIEDITTILVHLIRNSADHGIENKYLREYNYKNPQGKISVIVKTDNQRLYINIADDGQGISIKKIKKKIVEKGIMSIDEVDKLPEQEILNYIFKSGFSTAEKVTDISGRGVGMDLVKSLLSKLNGEIKIETEERKGTKFEIILPATILTS